MNGDLIEAALHVQAMRLVCEALEYREKDGIEVDWNVLRQMYDQMDAMLQALQHKHRYDSSEIVDLRRDRDHWKQARQDAHEAGELMKAEIETLKDEIKTLKVESSGLDQAAWYAEQELEKAKAEIETLRQQLDAAQAAVTLQRAGIERLRAFVAKARQTIGRTMNYCDVEFLLAALAELDAEGGQ